MLSIKSLFLVGLSIEGLFSVGASPHPAREIADPEADALNSILTGIYGRDLIGIRTQSLTSAANSAKAISDDFAKLVQSTTMKNAQKMFPMISSDLEKFATALGDVFSKMGKTKLSDMDAKSTLMALEGLKNSSEGAVNALIGKESLLKKLDYAEEIRANLPNGEAIKPAFDKMIANVSTAYKKELNDMSETLQRIVQESNKALAPN